ncbi:MAG: hypothetical protein AB1597_06255 [Chloroflexota bacterium]
MKNWPAAVTAAIIIIVGMLALACPQGNAAQAKASFELLQQVSLRKQQISSPTAETLARMKELGMRTEPLNIQRVFIYLAKPLTTEQSAELKVIGVSPYPESWIPPSGNHPAGFLLADMPVDKLDALAAKDFVIRLDTAEKKSEPQGGG